MSKFHWIIFFALILSLAACSPPMATRRQDIVVAPPPGGNAAQPTPPEEQEVSIPGELPSSAEGKKPAKTVIQSPPSHPSAVVALMREADASSASGSLDNAAATLERAIRIQPRNALLWQKLAVVRLQQQQPGLAEDLAKKSNVLSPGDKALTRKNWSIIAEARRKKGDAEGASEADAKARR